MERDQINEVNKKIAVFMGYYEMNGHFYSKHGGSGTWFKTLKYSYSWEKLMPVIIKICTFKFEDGDNCYVRTFGMMDEAGLYMFRFNRGTVFHAPTVMEAAYAAVSDFITWFNTSGHEQY